MAEQFPKNPPPLPESRFLPLAIAGSVCFIIAIMLGYGSWFVFGTNSPMHRKNADNENYAGTIVSKPAISETPETPVNPLPTPDAAPAETPKVNLPFPVVAVESGEVTLGGAETGKPLKRIFVQPFAIGETEVTNAQYAEFVRETKKHIPAEWKNGDFPKDKGDFPVTDISWQDAAAFCQWASEKYGAKISLPTEAEWQLAARGKENQKYPWGNKWNDEAAASKEKNGKLQAVKSLPLNKSPFGAFDMVGNVWEWMNDSVKIEDIGSNDDQKEEKQQALKSGKVLRLIKGGSASEPAKNISITAGEELPEDLKDSFLGFRIAVHRPETVNPAGKP